MPWNEAARYDIEGESLTITEVWQRAKARWPDISRYCIRDRLQRYNWRTWDKLLLDPAIGARSPWRKFRAVPYFSARREHMVQAKARKGRSWP